MAILPTIFHISQECSQTASARKQITLLAPTSMNAMLHVHRMRLEYILIVDVTVLYNIMPKMILPVVI